MDRTRLHLVSLSGRIISPEIQSAVETAYRWAGRQYPFVDPALIADWAEHLAQSMEEKAATIGSPSRYAYAALLGRVRDWLKTGAAREISVGVGVELESWCGVSGSFQGSVDRKILFDQLKASLSERDRYILVLLLQDTTSPTELAAALGVTYAAASKAVQRVKERIASILLLASEAHSEPYVSKTKG